MDDVALSKEFLKCCQMVSARELSWGASGNFSLRLGDDSFLVSASGSHFSFMDDSEIARCRISEDDVLSGARPSVEAALHRAVYSVREDVRFVLHVHPFYSVLAASSENLKVDLNVIPEAEHYLGSVAEVPFLSAGTAELADEVKAKAEGGCDFVVLESHGVVSLGSDFKKMIAAVEAYEFIAKLSYFSHAGDISLKKVF